MFTITFVNFEADTEVPVEIFDDVETAFDYTFDYGYAVEGVDLNWVWNYHNRTWESSDVEWANAIGRFVIQVN